MELKPYTTQNATFVERRKVRPVALNVAEPLVGHVAQDITTVPCVARYLQRNILEIVVIHGAVGQHD